MEYLPGKSLADLVAQHGPLAPSRVVWLLEQTCEALAEAHSLGLIHRDIKPGNIFAAERGGVFDVAKLLGFRSRQSRPPSNGDMNLTQEGSITGSPLFMAPEQATGDGAPDARSDIYALGAVGYYLLTGHPPFEADNPVKVLLAHAQQTVKPPSQLQPGSGRSGTDCPAVYAKEPGRSLPERQRLGGRSGSDFVAWQMDSRTCIPVVAIQRRSRAAGCPRQPPYRSAVYRRNAQGGPCHARLVRRHTGRAGTQRRTGGNAGGLGFVSNRRGLSQFSGALGEKGDCPPLRGRL